MIREIPLQGVNELFQVEINGVTYRMRIKYNHKLEQWCMDLGTLATWLICNLAMTTGQNLLIQYDHLDLGFALYVQVDGQPEGEATFSNLGTDARLLLVVEEAESA